MKKDRHNIQQNNKNDKMNMKKKKKKLVEIKT
jgi:hypothetical protein